MTSQANKSSQFFGTSPLETTKELRNIAAKNAEGELVEYMGKPLSKEYLNRNDIIISIDKFKKNYNRKNTSKNTSNISKKNFENFKTKYQKLSKWRQYHKDLEKLRTPGKGHLSNYGYYANNNNNSGNNNESNYINSVEGKINGINVKAVLKKTDQRPTVFNRLTKRFTTKKTSNQYLPTQQNSSNIQKTLKNATVRPATPVTSVTPVNTSVSKPWYQFWGGGSRTHHAKRHKRSASRKTHRK